jgi:hypothetical protein
MLNNGSSPQSKDFLREISVEEIAIALGTVGSAGGAYRCDCPVCGYRALSVYEDDNGAVRFHCYSCNDKRAIQSHLKARGLLPSRQSPEMLQATQLAEATATWAAGGPVEGSVAAHYFGHWRKIPGPYPSTLRYVSNQFSEPWKNLVALTQSADGKILGVHLTKLDLFGEGKQRLGRRRSPYRRFGLLDGGGVWFGTPGDGELIVGEGIETTLAAMIVLESSCGVASLGAKGMTRLVLPGETQHVHIAADNDVAGDGQQAADEARARWTAEGRRVRVSTPNTAGADFNDILMVRCRNDG